MTTAASKFIESALVAWDSRDPWEQTAAKGLADVDADALHALCEDAGEEYDDAEAEVMAFVSQKVA